MRFLDQLVLASSFLAAASEANPIAATSDPNTFSIHQVVKHGGINRENRSLHAINKIRRKFGHHAPAAPPLSQVQKAKSKAKSSGVKGSSKAGSNTESAKNDDGDIQYICEVEVGGQTVRLNFDTGSSDLWVYSTEQHPRELKDHKVYDPKNSTSAKKMDGGTWTIKYGDGSAASGIVYTDSVTVGNTTVDSQAVELAKNVSNSFLQDFANDGLLGLGFTKGKTPNSGNTVSVNGAAKPQTTFFENARPKLPLPLFTADLKHQAPGAYDFGYIDKTKFSGEIKYFSADTSEAYWGIESEDYGFKGQNIDRKIKTIVDTGTTLMLMPQDVLTKYYKEVPQAKVDANMGGYIFPCISKLPDFTIGFGSGSDKFIATIPSKYMNFGPAVASDPTTCFGGMQVMAPGSGLDAIYGAVFLKAVFTVFEAASNEKARMGFAMKPEALALIGNNSSATTNSTSRPDSNSPDLGSPESGSPDSGSLDSGSLDSGSPDSGSPDSGSPDSGSSDSGSPDSGSDPNAGSGECMAKTDGKKHSFAAKAIKIMLKSLKEKTLGIKAQKQGECIPNDGSSSGSDSGDEGFGGDGAGFDGSNGFDDGEIISTYEGNGMGDFGDQVTGSGEGLGSDLGSGEDSSGGSGEDEEDSDDDTGEDCHCDDEEDSGDADEEDDDEDTDEEEPEEKHREHGSHKDHGEKSEQKHKHHDEEEHNGKHAEHGSKKDDGSKSHKPHSEGKGEDEEEEHKPKHSAKKHMKHKSKGEDKASEHFESRKHHVRRNLYARM